MKKTIVTSILAIILSVFMSIAEVSACECVSLSFIGDVGVCLDQGYAEVECYPVSVFGDCTQVECRFPGHP